MKKTMVTITRSYYFWLPLSLILVLSAAYSAYAYSTQSKSLYGMKLFGIDLSHKNKKDLTNIIQTINDNIDDKKITIKYGDDTRQYSYKELGIEIDIPRTVDSIISYEKRGFWINSKYFAKILKNGSVNITPKVKWASSPIDKIDELYGDLNVEPSNPILTLNSSSVSIEPEKNGSGVNSNDLKTKIEDCIKSNCSDEIIAQKMLRISNISSTDLDNFIPEIEDIVNSRIYFTSKYHNLYPKNSDLINFIDEERTVLSQKVSFSDQDIDNYLNNASKWFNTKGRNKVISSSDGSVIDEGEPGLELDVEESRKNIKDSLNSRKKYASLVVSTSDIKETYYSPGNNPGKYDGKFIEINLSEQNLYAFEGETLISTYKVSTGKWSMPTPEGEYTINNKVQRAYSQTYKLYMPYWMAFIGSEYGIHELPEWPDGTKEGESHLGTPVSHGCVRLGRGAAESIYNWAEVGTPVFIHK